MNQKSKRFSLTNLSYIEEMKTKLQKLDLIRHRTDAMIVQLDLHLKTNTKRKSIYSNTKKRTLQPLSIQNNLFTNKSIPNNFHSTIFNDHSPITPHRIIPSTLHSPTNDEYSTFSISTINRSVGSEQISIKDKVPHDSQEDSQLNEYSYRKYRTSRSITSSSSLSSPSTNSHDQPSLVPNTLIIGRLYILNEIYPSIEYENINGTPLAFLGSKKFLHIPIDWTKVQYPLSSSHIEIIIDLIIKRPSFIREIPKVTKFNLYRPLIKTISGHLFFDYGHHKAAIHRCNRKQINHKFTIQDLASIHQREFYIINYNVTHEQRFINLYENLFQIHFYQTTK